MFLILAQVPPPVHGAAIINARAVALIKEMYPSSISINTSAAESISDVGKFSAHKLFKVAILYFNILTKLFRNDIKYCYVNVHPVGKVFFRDAVFCLLSKLFRKKVVIHIHGRGVPKKRSWLLDFLYKSTFKNTHVLHLSDMFYEELAELVTRSNFTAIPNCTDDLKHLTKNKTTDVLQVYCLSNYMKGKGAIDLLNAAKYIYRPNIGCKFVLAGGWFEPEFKVEIESWARAHQYLIDSGYIKILGPVHGEQKNELIKCSDIFVFPSYIDTFPLVVLEALSAGKLVISTMTGATPEILAHGNAGILTPEKDHIALAEKIVKVVQNPEIIRTYSAAARNQFLANYTEVHFRTVFRSTILKITSRQAP